MSRKFSLHHFTKKLVSLFRINCVAVIFILSYWGYSQINKNKIVLQHVTEGITESSISKILEDRDGFLWLGTSNGLVKFDGRHFQKYTKNQDVKTGFNSNDICEIYQSNKGCLYIGTNKGLSFFDKELNVIKQFPFKAKGKVLSSRSIRSMIEINNFLWIGTLRNGLYRYNINSGETKQFFLNTVDNTDNYVLKIVKLGVDTVIAFTQNGVYVLSEDFKIKKHYKGIKGINCITKVEGRNFLLGTLNGSLFELKILEDSTIKILEEKKVSNYSLMSIVKGNSENIWIGTENDGLYIFSGKKKIHLKNNQDKPKLIPGNSIWSLYKTKNDVIWLGYFKKGLSFYDTEYYKFKHIKNDFFSNTSLSNGIVNCFLEDEGQNLWIGTDGGGLNYWDKKQDIHKHYSLENGKLSANVILSIIRNKDKLWLGTWGKGLVVFDTKSETYQTWNSKNSFLSSDNVMHLIKDQKGHIWFANFFGSVQVYNPKTKEYKNVKIISEKDNSDVVSISKLLEDEQGNIWVGSQTDGVFRLKEDNGEWKVAQFYNTQSKTHKISNDFVNVLAKDANGLIWVGTQAGLNKYDPEKDSFISITKEEGLKNDAIKSIEFDQKGNLWLGTGEGIINFNPTDYKTVNYSRSDGLQGDGFNASSSFKTSLNELIFGGSNGYNIFKPNQIRKRKDKPKIYLSKLKVYNKLVSPNDEFNIIDKHISQIDSLSLNYNYDVVNFGFEAITFRHPEKINYAYFLEGFESEWNYIGNKNNVTYTNLDPGEYTLHIKSTNSDGEWQDNEKKLFIEVIPPFWMTWWFRFLAFGLLIFVTYLFYYLRVKNIKKYQKNLKEEINERTKELQFQKDKLLAVADELSTKNEEIQRFAFSLSHDLKSPLSNIKAISGLIQMELPVKGYPFVEKYLEMIDVSYETMNDLITDITTIARIGKIKNKKEVLDANKIMKLSKTLVSAKLDEQNIELIIPNNLPSIYADRNRIIQIFGNLLDNAIKYMGDQKNPLITIQAEENEETTRFFVKDNGLGMNEKSLERLFSPFERFHAGTNGTGLGLYMIKQMIESHGGVISANSDGEGKGAIFIVELPKKNTIEIASM